MRPPKCIWSGERHPDVKPLELKTINRIGTPVQKTIHIRPVHEAEFRKYNDMVLKAGRPLFYTILLIIGLMLLASLIPIFIRDGIPFATTSVGLLTMLLGFLTYRYPCATPETVEWLGIRKSIKLVRYGAIFLVATGAAIMLVPVYAGV